MQWKLKLNDKYYQIEKPSKIYAYKRNTVTVNEICFDYIWNPDLQIVQIFENNAAEKKQLSKVFSIKNLNNMNEADKHKELIDKSIIGINSTDLERWIDVTGYLLNEEVKRKADKKINQKRQSDLLSLIVISLFAMSLNQ